MIDCKVSGNKCRQQIGLQMYGLKIMQFKIDYIFRKNPRWWPPYKWCPYKIFTLTAVLDGMLDALFFIQSHYIKLFLKIVCINSNYILPVPNESI